MGKQDLTAPPLTALFLRLVGGVPAVVLAVALPAGGNAASGVFTAELVHAARHLGCEGGGDERGEGHFGGLRMAG